MKLSRALLVAAFAGALCGACGRAPTDEAGTRATAEDIVHVVASSERRSEETVLSAPDALDAEVHVPDGALPAGLTGDQITAEVLAFDNAEGDGTAGIAFRLSPGGTRFTMPVTIEWDGPWDPQGRLALQAFDDAGEPIPDEFSDRANSINALQIEPTGEDRAHYRLPVDHFSTWSVSMTGSGRNMTQHMSATATFPDALASGETVRVPVQVTGQAFMATAICTKAAVLDVVGPIIASIPAGKAPCTREGWGGDLSTDVELQCTATGATTVRGALYTMVGISLYQSPLLDPNVEFDRFRVSMLRAAAALDDFSTPSETDLFPFGQYGALFITPFEATVQCGPAATEPTSSTGGGSASTTTATPNGSTGSTGSTASTAEGHTATTNPADEASTTAAPGPTATVPTGTASTVAPVTAPPSTAMPIGSSSTVAVLPPSSTTPATVPPPPSSSSTTTSTVWGAPGEWAFNELGSCNWNGSGGCGWYFGSVEGSYTMGPMGAPGSTW